MKPDPNYEPPSRLDELVTAIEVAGRATGHNAVAAVREAQRVAREAFDEPHERRRAAPFVIGFVACGVLITGAHLLGWI